MFKFFQRKKSEHITSEEAAVLKENIEFILMMMIGMLRRYDIPEDEIARVVKDEKFISELYLAKLVSLLKETNDGNPKSD